MSETKKLTDEALREVLRGVDDPELHKDLVSLGMIKEIKIDGQKVDIQVQLTTPACPLKNEIGDDVRKAVLAEWPGLEVKVDFGSKVDSHSAGGGGKLFTRDRIEGVQNVILVGSGKGGVGKSTVAVNLAYALQKQGAKVGLADVDVYGPSLPLMVKLDEMPAEEPVEGKKVDPPKAHGLPVSSLGYMIDDDQPVIWRGPMLAGAALQLLQDIKWGSLDYLVVDLPPGTGDVQLSIAQKIDIAGAVIVSTPQDVALSDVRRSKKMFDRVNIDTLGVIENMSYFICDGCGKRHDIFATGGAEKAAGELDTNFLGALPIDVATRDGADKGKPVVLDQPDSAIAKAFMEIASKVAARIAVLASEQDGSESSDEALKAATQKPYLNIQ